MISNKINDNGIIRGGAAKAATAAAAALWFYAPFAAPAHILALAAAERWAQRRK